jgi:hypothetical protein
MRHINPPEKDELLRFFLRNMTQEQRGQLMATYPLHYAMLFPNVGKETIAFKVVDQIQWMEENSKDPIPNPSPIL